MNSDKQEKKYFVHMTKSLYWVMMPIMHLFSSDPSRGVPKVSSLISGLLEETQIRPLIALPRPEVRELTGTSSMHRGAFGLTGSSTFMLIDMLQGLNRPAEDFTAIEVTEDGYNKVQQIGGAFSESLGLECFIDRKGAVKSAPIIDALVINWICEFIVSSEGNVELSKYINQRTRIFSDWLVTIGDPSNLSTWIVPVVDGETNYLFFQEYAGITIWDALVTSFGKVTKTK